jgi:hypothetical protein
MTLAPWYFLTFWLTPAPSVPVLVPQPDYGACEQYAQRQLQGWTAYLKRNRAALSSADPNWGWTSWIWKAPPPPLENSDPQERSLFRFHAGPITVVGECLSSSELTPQERQALATSP